MIEKRVGHRWAAGKPMDRWKMEPGDYLDAAADLSIRMSVSGFDAGYPVPVDPDGELLDGSHRVACALALDLPLVPVWKRPEYVWAPAWGAKWFEDAGLDVDTVSALRDELSALSDGNG